MKTLLIFIALSILTLTSSCNSQRTLFNKEKPIAYINSNKQIIINDSLSLKQTIAQSLFGKNNISFDKIAIIKNIIGNEKKTVYSLILSKTYNGKKIVTARILKNKNGKLYFAKRNGYKTFATCVGKLNKNCNPVLIRKENKLDFVCGKQGECSVSTSNSCDIYRTIIK